MAKGTKLAISTAPRLVTVAWVERYVSGPQIGTEAFRLRSLMPDAAGDLLAMLNAATDVSPMVCPLTGNAIEVPAESIETTV